MASRIYLDKGVLGLAQLHMLDEIGLQLCYSEATLMDMKNDKTDSYISQLKLLNECKALYLFRDGESVLERRGDSFDEFKSTDRVEAEAMAEIYRFFNGGGPERSLWDIMQAMIDKLAKLDPIVRPMFDAMSDLRISNVERDQMQGVSVSTLGRQRQKATRAWSEDVAATIKTALESNPEVEGALLEAIPRVPRNFEEIHHSAMLLGAIGLGQDKGITSPQDVRSRHAAERGYIDCLHIAFAFFCEIFITSDKATFRRFQLLNEYWGFKKAALLLGKGI